jgi:NAD+ diphosphatase
MLHEIFPHQFNNAFDSSRTIGENDFVFHFRNQTLLMVETESGLELPRPKDVEGYLDLTQSNYLFSLDEKGCFLVWSAAALEGASFVYKEIRFFRTFPQTEVAWISMVAFHLTNWYHQNQYCGLCGAANHHKKSERALVCSRCEATVYPRISPAIIVAILHEDKILLAHNSNFPGSWYSLVAGYADVGESLEETVAREVREEVGLEVKNIRYYKSQPWPFSGSMMIGFFAEAVAPDAISVDNKEITHAEWFRRGQLPDHPPAISIAGEMIECFEQNKVPV